MKEALLQQLGCEVQHCTRCALCQTRHNVVLGCGNAHARVMVVGEGPGAEEDRQGLPFVGAAGELLTRMLQSIGLPRQSVYIANAIKCRPPGNRTPHEGELEACRGFLLRQLEIVSPDIVLCMGTVAGRTLLHAQLRVTRDRGQWQVRQGVSYLCTYHPAALLRDPTLMIDAWRDLQLLKHRLEDMDG